MANKINNPNQTLMRALTRGLPEGKCINNRSRFTYEFRTNDGYYYNVYDGARLIDSMVPAGKFFQEYTVILNEGESKNG